MSVIKFRISWEEDTAVQRDFEITSSHTFYELHTFIKQIFEIPLITESLIYVCNETWKHEVELSSVVEKNLRDAPSLSMKRTSIGALIKAPHQKFKYISLHEKRWAFILEIITLLPDVATKKTYPNCTRTEGISPSQIGINLTKKDSIMEIEEKYDLNSRDGYGDEGDDETSDNLLPDEEFTSESEEL